MEREEDKAGPTARIYRDAWAFFREAEAHAEEGKDRAARAYARAAVLHAAAAAEGFLEGVIRHMEVAPDIDAKADGALAGLRDGVSRNHRLGDEWNKLLAVMKAVEEARGFPDSENREAAAEPLKDEVRKRLLDLAIALCREHLHDGRLAKALERLTDLRSEIGKRTLKNVSLAKRWFEGATGLPGNGAGSREAAGRDFQRIVGKARGESAASGAPDIAVEEARLACGAVRSMIASVCGAAGRKVPQWVREIHDRLP